MRNVFVLAKNSRSERLRSVLSPADFQYLDLRLVKVPITSRIGNRLNGLFHGQKRHSSSEQMTARALMHQIGREDAGIVSLDNSISLIHALVNEGFKGPILLIQHGTNSFSYGQEAPVVLPNSLLLSWGGREVSTYSLNGCRAEFVVPIGSILNYEYSKSQQFLETSVQSDQICIVSEFRDDQDEQSDDYMTHRVHSWSIILGQLRKCAEVLQMKLRVALRPSVFGAASVTRQKQYFANFLGQSCSFSEHDSLFSSYSMIDSSEIVVGLQSALLAESMGRNKKVVYLNPLNDTRMQPPLTGLCAAVGLNLDELVGHLRKVRSASIDEYQGSVHPSLGHLIRRDFDTRGAIVLAGSLFKRGCSAAETTSVLSRL